MSQPKKKTSRSRRDIRRHASGNRLNPVSWTKATVGAGDLVRPHRLTPSMIDDYVKARSETKSSK